MSAIKNILNGFKKIMVEIKEEVFLNNSLSEKIKSGEIKYKDLSKEDKQNSSIVRLAYIHEGNSILPLIAEQENGYYLIKDMLSKIPKKKPKDVEVSLKRIEAVKELFNVLPKNFRDDIHIVEIFNEKIKDDIMFLLKYGFVDYKNAPSFMKEDPYFANMMYLRSNRNPEVFKEIKRNKNSLEIQKKIILGSEFVSEEYENLTEEAQNDKEIIAKLIVQKPEVMINKLSKEHLSDNNLAVLFVKKDWEYIKKLPESVRDDRLISLVLLSQKTYLVFPYIGTNIKYDRAIMEKMVEIDSYGSRKFFVDKKSFVGKADNEIKELIKKIPELYCEAPYHIQEDLELAKYISNEFLVNVRKIYYSLPEKIKKDKSLLKIQVKKDSSVYDLLSEDLKKDRDLVKLAAEEKKFTRIPEGLENDKEVILSLLKRNSYLYQDLNENLQADLDILRTTLKGSGRQYYFLEHKFKENKELIILAGETDNIYRNIPEILKKDRDIVLALLKHNDIFDDLPSEVRNDKEIALEIVKKYPKNLGDLSDSLQSDSDFVRKVIDINPVNIKYFSYRNKTLIAYEITLKKIRDMNEEKKVEVLEYAPDHIKGNYKFMTEWLDVNPKEFKYMTKDMRGDIQFATKMVKKMAGNIEFIEDNLIEHENFIIDYLKFKPSYFKYLSIENKERKDILEVEEVRSYLERYNPEYLELSKKFDREDKLMKDLAEVTLKKEEAKENQTRGSKKKI